MNPDHAFDQQLMIRSVIERYFSAVDRRDFDLLATCFTKDVEFELNLETTIRLNGVEALMDRMRSLPSPTASSHGLANTSIAVDGDKAKSTTFTVVHALVGPVVGGTLLIRGLRYDDDFRRDGGVWRIARRAHNPLWQHIATSVDPRVVPKS